MIVEADHNMFSDPEIDTEGDSGAYDPAHGAEWFNFLRQKGLLDVEREEMGRGARLRRRPVLRFPGCPAVALFPNFTVSSTPRW